MLWSGHPIRCWAHPPPIPSRLCASAPLREVSGEWDRRHPGGQGPLPRRLGHSRSPHRPRGCRGRSACRLPRGQGGPDTRGSGRRIPPPASAVRPPRRGRGDHLQHDIGRLNLLVTFGCHPRRREESGVDVETVGRDRIRNQDLVGKLLRLRMRRIAQRNEEVRPERNWSSSSLRS